MNMATYESEPADELARLRQENRRLREDAARDRSARDVLLLERDRYKMMHRVAEDQLNAQIETTGEWRDKHHAAAQRIEQLDASLKIERQLLSDSRASEADYMARIAQLEAANATLTAANVEYCKRHVAQLGRIELLEQALRQLIRGYVRTLEAGRDRIIDYGGSCDAVDAMERADPHLKEARAALAACDGQQPAAFSNDPPPCPRCGSMACAIDRQIPEPPDLFEQPAAADGPHHELCDVNDVNAEGIVKPCNCASDGVAGE